MSRRKTAAILSLVVALAAACSPALNWRTVPLNGLVAMLPCKPDRAERSLPLGAGQEVTVAMAGCEAAGALYAVSHLRVADSKDALRAQTAWRQAILANLQDPTVQTQAFALAKPKTRANEPNPGLEILTVQGKGPDGKPLQARLLWLARGQDVYHVAVYAPELKPALFDMLFSDLALQ